MADDTTIDTTTSETTSSDTNNSFTPDQTNDDPNYVITQGSFVKVIDGKINGNVISRPEWYDAETSKLLSDYLLATRENMYRVDYETNKPQIDFFYQTIVQNDQDEWIIDDNKYIVYVTYSINNIPIDDIINRITSDIKSGFANELNNGVVNSSLGFPVDARRSGMNNDKDNIQTLLDLNQFPVNFRDHNNEFHQLQQQDLITIKNELNQKGVEIYAKKWQKETDLNSIRNNYNNNTISYDEAIQQLKIFIPW